MWSKLYTWWISRRGNIKVEGELILLGRPLIDIRPECRLCIGNGVTLNSRNKGYFINMHSPVKLFADHPGAQILIGEKTRIHGTCIHAYQSVEIGKNCLIAANCHIIDCNGHACSFDDVENRIRTRGEIRPVKIEDNVWVGAGTMILPGVTIGRGSIISANSVVTKNIPPMVLAGGNPAIVIKDYARNPG